MDIKKTIAEKQFSKFMVLTIKGIKKDYLRKNRKYLFTEVSAKLPEIKLLKGGTTCSYVIDENLTLAALDYLSPKEREVIYLTIICEFTEKKTSYLLNISQQAVNSTKKRGLSRLREILGDEYG